MFQFSARQTPRGCAVSFRTPRRFQEKRFRNGCTRAITKAQDWVTQQVDGLEEFAAVDNLSSPVLHVSGELSSSPYELCRPQRPNTDSLMCDTRLHQGYVWIRRSGERQWQCTYQRLFRTVVGVLAKRDLAEYLKELQDYEAGLPAITDTASE